MRLKPLLTDSIFTGIQTLKRDKWVRKCICSPCKIFQQFFFSIFGSSVSAGWPDTAAKTHRAISTLSLDASNLAYLSRYSKLIYEHSKLYTAHPCCFLVLCPQDCTMGLTSLSAHDPVFTLCFMASHRALPQLI